jgi:hypothetical protein
MSRKVAAKQPKPRADHASPLEQMLADLRGGADGVTRWNARPEEERKAENLRGVHLSRAHLAGVDLGSLDLTGARLDGATLTEAWLLECNLEGARLAGANLEQAWCVGACFPQANLEGASLARCNLRGSDFRKANLRGAGLQGATLDGADLCGADLLGATLAGASFREARYDEHTRWPQGTEGPVDTKWVGNGVPTIDFDVFMRRLPGLIDPRRLGRALEMLKAERFRLFSQLEGDTLMGVVKSQTEADLVYACRLSADGSFSCCSQDLSLCLGLRNALCKHLLVLVVGLVKSGEIGAAVVEGWVRASRQKAPLLEADPMADVLFRYKAAEAGEIDWRPTETIPEDYYAF